MFRTIAFIALLFAANTSAANTPSPRHQVWIEPQDIVPVCWFEGEQYSEGAIVSMTERTRKICAQKVKNHTNGTLVWLSVDKNDQPIYSNENKISIN